MFLPATRDEMAARGWDALDVILVSGDAYVDSPFGGAAVVGRTLEAAGFRTGILAQPDWRGLDDIRRLGAPRLFWGVTAGGVDSMVANYTATGRKRRQDDFTPGGVNDRRPDRASLAYANLIRRACRPCAPIVLGGIEASLRRIAHYDFWSDRVRGSLLFDAKADLLVYGMAEQTVVELARRLAAGRDARGLAGTCHAAPSPPPDAVVLPDFEAAAADKGAFLEMFRLSPPTRTRPPPAPSPSATAPAGWCTTRPRRRSRATRSTGPTDCPTSANSTRATPPPGRSARWTRSASPSPPTAAATAAAASAPSPPTRAAA